MAARKDSKPAAQQYLLSAVRLLIFHGYLLRGTGSNVYNAELAEALVRLGHEVHLLCQEPRPAELGFVDSFGTWEADSSRSRDVRRPAHNPGGAPSTGPTSMGCCRCTSTTTTRGSGSRPSTSSTDEELDRYIAANVAAVRDVVQAAELEAGSPTTL